MNSRGQLGSQLFFIPFLLLMLIVAGGIATGVYLYYGQDYEFGQIDADLLAYRISNCIQESVIEVHDFYNACELSNESMISHELIARVCVDSKECAIETNPLFNLGSNFQACQFNVNDNKAFPTCKTLSFVQNGKNYTIIAGSNQDIRRERI